MPSPPWPMAVDLTGRTAIVTGASEGIGAATVHALAEHGANVAFCSRSAHKVDSLLERLRGSRGTVRGYPADMADAADTERFLDAVAADLGDADIVVNNVGDSPSRNFLYLDDAAWTSLMELNLMSAVRCTRRVLPAMRARKWGRVIMISTGAAKYPNPALIDYSASKAALVATAKALATKYGADGVLVNSILPGLIRTAMWERTAEEVAAATNTTPEAVIADRGKRVPLGRFGSAEEVAAVVLFLSSDYASYLNGCAIQVDGGMGGTTF
jgi:NAD(P)-dependent dehydrogenase (short-subunit alcohol dehydrogenase family)